MIKLNQYYVVTEIPNLSYCKIQDDSDVIIKVFNSGLMIHEPPHSENEGVFSWLYDLRSFIV